MFLYKRYNIDAIIFIVKSQIDNSIEELSDNIKSFN